MKVGLIPVHLESTRLNSKALVDICGLPMIIHVLFRSKMCENLDEVYVATDSEAIREVVESFGGKVIMTSSVHENGTSRCCEAAKSLDAEYIVTIFGDEALLNPEHITRSIEGLEETDADASILVLKYREFNTPTSVKVVLNKDRNLMYMSRSDIPSSARVKPEYMYKAYHILSYRRDSLLRYASLKKSFLESIEYNEHLRMLENGYKIHAVEVDYDCVSVDDAASLDIVRKQMIEDPLFPLYCNKKSLYY